MVTVKKITMYIIDMETRRHYPWVGLFESDAEFVQFLEENMEVGNLITVEKIEVTKVYPWELDQVNR